MLSKEVYIQRLSRFLEAQDELAFLERLSAEELSVLWSKLARKSLKASLAPGSERVAS